MVWPWFTTRSQKKKWLNIERVQWNNQIFIINLEWFFFNCFPIGFHIIWKRKKTCKTCVPPLEIQWVKMATKKISIVKMTMFSHKHCYNDQMMDRCVNLLINCWKKNTIKIYEQILLKFTVCIRVSICTRLDGRSQWINTLFIKLETHANRWVVTSFCSLKCLAIASFLIKFKTFFPPKLPKDKTRVGKMCFYTIGLTKNYKSIVHNDLDLEYSVVIWFIKDTIKKNLILKIYFFIIYIYFQLWCFWKTIVSWWIEGVQAPHES
jgi:hypothetical protein